MHPLGMNAAIVVVFLPSSMAFKRSTWLAKKTCASSQCNNLLPLPGLHHNQNQNVTIICSFFKETIEAFASPKTLLQQHQIIHQRESKRLLHVGALQGDAIDGNPCNPTNNKRKTMLLSSRPAATASQELEPIARSTYY